MPLKFFEAGFVNDVCDVDVCNPPKITSALASNPQKTNKIAIDNILGFKNCRENSGPVIEGPKNAESLMIFEIRLNTSISLSPK